MFKSLISNFKSGKSPLIGIGIILFFGGVSMFFLPYLFTRNLGLPSFTETGNIGDTFNGIAGPFIALAASILTFLAFWVQYQANQEQKKQFENQNQDQIFFRLIDSQVLRIINSSFRINEQEIRSFQLFEKIVEDFKFDINEHSRLFARDLLRREPETIGDLYLQKMFALDFGGLVMGLPIAVLKFAELKKVFLERMLELDSSDRWEYLKMYFGSTGKERGDQKDVLEAIGSVYFYKVEYEIRQDIYRKAFQQIEKKYGSLLDGYLRGLEFICAYSNNAFNKDIYTKYLKAQLTKHEMVVVFYYIASAYADKDFVKFIKENKFLENLHYYNAYFIDVPSKEQIDNELNYLFNY